MNHQKDPNPPSRRAEDFPKTTTVPEGWDTQAMMEKYNREEPGSGCAGNARPIPIVDDESLFTRRLDPFPKPNTIPAGWDVSAM